MEINQVLQALIGTNWWLGTSSYRLQVQSTSCKAWSHPAQDDIVHEHLTVREQLYYSARLRNAEGTPPAMINNIVEDVLNVMQLLDVQHSLVGDVEKRGISRFGFYVSDDVSPMGTLRLRHGYVCGNLQGQGVHSKNLHH